MVEQNNRTTATFIGSQALPDHVPRGLLSVVVARPKVVLLVSLLFIVIAGVLGVDALSSLKVGGYDLPDSQSTVGSRILADKFPAANPNLVVYVEKTGGGLEDRDITDIGHELTAKLANEPGVNLVASYWDTPVEQLRNRGNYGALIMLRVSGDEDQSAKVVQRLHTRFSRAAGPVRVQFGGVTQANNDMNAQATKDLATAESVAIPLTLVLLLIVFGTVVAAGLPLFIGILSIIGTLGVLRALALFYDVSVFSVNLAIALGLGLAVDYSLLFVSRYREEFGRRPDTTSALVVTMRTAGRTIVFSGATVAVALSCLLVFPQYLLRSFAYAGVAVVAVTVAGALVALPALLALLGNRVNRGRLPWRRAVHLEPDVGFWGKVAGKVLRAPLSFGVPVLAGLLLLSIPISHVHFGLADERVLPTTAESRQVADQLRDHFATGGMGSLAVVAESWPTTARSTSQVADYASALSRVPGVRRVDSAAGSYAYGSPTPAMARDLHRLGDSTWLSVVSDVEPYSSAAANIAREVRAVPVPGGHSVLVTGQPAQLVDVSDEVAARVPLALGLIALTALALLLLLTGSVLLSVEALLINLLTMAAVFGVLVWVFQDGHLASLLGFTPTTMSVVFPVLVFCVSFGLSMDYQVFVLARITELHNEGLPLRSAVVLGLSSSGRVISAAAGVLCVSFFAMVTSQVSFIQFIGLGAALAVLLDALIVRPVLVPALMSLGGRLNWWAPAPVRALHRRFGPREN
ncbi:MMPL family transporter [Kutzneria viridogrisea]|uniref:RND superfamily putative drug exporter n=1 Tax=Kutzneria viridogrisea TaxID=47990 RepID=A0ABR6BYU5_9PSEU|nr:MMPL family transporter [Kutzneria albida]MBA8932082.1 RND superfamily putative drug exporter [Kutzneria viridogrisea]